MPFYRCLLGAALGCAMPVLAAAQSAGGAGSDLNLELNALRDVDGACRMTFVVQNETGAGIEQAVFETVIFDLSGGVLNLSLFDFRDLPADRLRVREFELPGIACDGIGKVLINGANTCAVDGIDSTICDSALTLGSRLSVELLG